MSNSGESEEVVRLIKPVRGMGATLIGMTAVETSTLARHSDIKLTIGQVAEAGNLGLVPTASTTAMMVLGDALAVCLFHCRGFGRDEYARFHPGGELGRKLMTVREVMRGGAENPVIGEAATVREALKVMSETPGRPGAVSIVDARGNLAGFFTDGDLRRLLLKDDFDADSSIAAVMHKNPKQVSEGALVAEAVLILREHKIDQVPVVDSRGKPVGLFDVQDLLSTKDA
jgi:arabinose-5-phosphate isomerase